MLCVCSTVGDGTAAADMPVRQPNAIGAVGEGAACAEYRSVRVSWPRIAK